MIFNKTIQKASLRENRTHSKNKITSNINYISHFRTLHYHSTCPMPCMIHSDLSVQLHSPISTGLCFSYDYLPLTSKNLQYFSDNKIETYHYT